MCDYCDCRSEPAIAALSADHDLLVSTLHELSQAAESDDHERIHSLVAAAAAGDVGAAKDLDRVLRHHILLEESDLFPAAHQLLSPAQWNAVAYAA